MDSRGRKRTEAGEHLPADKRACSSSGFRSASPPPPPPPPEAEAPPLDDESVNGDDDEEDEYEDEDEDEDEDKEEDEDANDTDRSEEPLEDGAINKSDVKARIDGVVMGLGSGEEHLQVVALAELIDMLLFTTVHTIDCMMPRLNTLVPALVGTLDCVGSAEVLLASARAVFYLCDTIPESVSTLARHGALPVLCQRLLAPEYLDLGEQCVQALEKISQKKPVQCMEAGTVMACLAYIDFFSTPVQKVALSTVANVCNMISPDHHPLVMDAVPILSGILQYEDDKLVETAAACLRRIVEGFSQSPEKLEQICKDALISQCVNSIASNGSRALMKTFNDDLMRVLSRFASHSPEVVKTLLRLNLSATLRDILMSSCASTAATSRPMLESGHCNQVLEVFKLLNQLLPPIRACDETTQQSLAKKQIFLDEPHLLHQFALNIFPLLIQVIDSGTSSCIRYGCLSVMKSIAYISTPESLLNILNETNISRFLANLLSYKDDHILVSALHIADVLLQKHPDMFLHQFVKEGVVSAIDLLLKLNGAHSTIDQPPSLENSSSSNSQVAIKRVSECLCYAFELSQSSKLQTRSCEAGKATTRDLAKLIKSTHFVSLSGSFVSSEILNMLKTFCSILNDNVLKFSETAYNFENEEYLAHILGRILSEIKVDDMSTFEFIESGIVKSFMEYLCDGRYLQRELCSPNFQCRHHVVMERCRTFARITSSRYCPQQEDLVLTVLVRKLQASLSSLGKFPIITSQPFKSIDGVYADIPHGRTTWHPSFKVRFVRDEFDSVLSDYSIRVLTVEPSSSFNAIEEYLWPKIAPSKYGTELMAKGTTETVDDLNVSQLKVNEGTVTVHANIEHSKFNVKLQAPTSSMRKGITNGELQQQKECARNGAYTGKGPAKDGKFPVPHMKTHTDSKMMFYLDGKEIDRSLTLYQAIIQHKLSLEPDITLDSAFWNEVHKITYKRAEPKDSDFPSPTAYKQSHSFWAKLPFFSSLLAAELPCKWERANPCYDILFLLRTLEGINKHACILTSKEGNTFSEGWIPDFSKLSVTTPLIPESEFLNTRLSEKLKLQMADSFSSVTGNVPAWFSRLVALCPFMFSFKVRFRFFRVAQLASLTTYQKQRPHPDNHYTDSQNVPRSNNLRRKFGVDRSHILESAKKIMESAHCEVLEVEYDGEVGTGLGPTLEFYALVSQAFQKLGLNVWRGDHVTGELVDDNKYVAAPMGLFPHPWSTIMSSSNEIQFTEVITKFRLLGWLVARTLYDGRILDLPLSKAFYKLILEQELDIYDISSFDPELGRTLLEFQSLVSRSSLEEKSLGSPEMHFRGVRIEDLCIDFTLPGYPDYVLTTEIDSKMVDSANLEEFIALVVDATVRSGISRQMEAFKSGFNEVFPLRFLCIFSEEELEHLLCGERDTWTFDELFSNIKFDHGYTVGSSQVLDFLEVIQEFQCSQRRAFLQFVTGMPRLPPGGLSALNPKLTVVRKHVSGCADMDLPSVMTCANYLKLPPYSSKEKVKEKLLYAITEGQGSFHLS